MSHLTQHDDILSDTSERELNIQIEENITVASGEHESISTPMSTDEAEPIDLDKYEKKPNTVAPKLSYHILFWRFLQFGMQAWGGPGILNCI
jgi:hypothetical protein